MDFNLLINFTAKKMYRYGVGGFPENQTGNINIFDFQSEMSHKIPHGTKL